jgi:SAM-dependent methyltransferase
VSADNKSKWDNIYTRGSHNTTNPATVLLENKHLLPGTGVALDVACGAGSNALFLAQHGLDVHAWDISTIAISKLEIINQELKLGIDCQQRDIVAEPPEPDSFDIITVSKFLDRKLIPHLINALKENGLVFYQTFIQDKRDDTGPSTLAYRLESNELLQLFSQLKLIVYREEGRIGRLEAGFRNEAMLIAQRTT